MRAKRVRANKVDARKKQENVVRMAEAVSFKDGDIVILRGVVVEPETAQALSQFLIRTKRPNAVIVPVPASVSVEVLPEESLLAHGLLRVDTEMKQQNPDVLRAILAEGLNRYAGPAKETA